MQPKRILIVGNFGRKDLFRRYFNMESKLANGFIRAGHHVLCFSDRDHAREATIFRTQKLGARKMQEKLVELTAHYRPALVLVGHADLVNEVTYQRLREKVSGLRLAAFCVDALFRKATMQRFSARAQLMDAAFLTSADRQQAALLGIPAGRLFFVPNPVDSSMETARVFETPREALRLDGQFLGTGIERREDQIEFIRNSLPASYRFESGGKAFDTERVDSTTFLDRLAEAAVCPNLPLDDLKTEQLAYLYSSDRIAQTLGQGVTTLTTAASRLSDIYEDGVVEYSDRADLVEKMTALYEDDLRRMQIGEIGHRLAHERTGCSKVADYILSVCFGESEGVVPWPSALN